MPVHPTRSRMYPYRREKDPGKGRQGGTDDLQKARVIVENNGASEKRADVQGKAHVPGVSYG